MEEKTSITLKCVFCFSSEMEVPHEEYVPNSGEMIRCGNCGRLNDYDSLMRIARCKGLEWAEEQAQKLIEKEMKKMFKGFGR